MAFYYLLFILYALNSKVWCQQCGRYSCHGDVGNLVAGRRIRASSTCGENGSEVFCDPGSSDCSVPHCQQCLAGRNRREHPSSFLGDSMFFHSRTWWQASNNVDEVTLNFDLETTFYFTHLIMLFRSPRPGAMTIERSNDFGKTWQTYQRFARNCSKTFSLEDDVDVEGAKCTSRYSDPTPCHKGEVIFKVLNPLDLIEDPYSDEGRYLLKVTNIRIKMWNPQMCPSCVNSNIISTALRSRRKDLLESTQNDPLETNVTSVSDTSNFFSHFAIYDLIIRGTCFCNGHADTCVPLREDNSEPEDFEQDVVHGKCVCEHNTAGNHCETCLPLYHDAPWKPGNGGTRAANPCKRCKCHGHADRCRFDLALYTASGNRTGGVCENCQHNTAGRHCSTCKPGYFRRPDSELSDQDVCEECLCHRMGSFNSTIDIDGFQDDVIPCDLETGQCHCKPGVAGRRCGRCMKGFWGFGESGCRKCACNHCDQKTGICLPKYGDEQITFHENAETEPGEVIDLTGGNWESLFLDPIFDDPDHPIKFPDDDDDDDSMLSVYRNDPYVIMRSDVEEEIPRMEETWRASRDCTCKDRGVKGQREFCKMKYDYAVRIKVREARDLGTHALLSVQIRRVIKQGEVRIRKGKNEMYPESWTIMGCTCPFLKPGNDYLVIGHEDPVKQRLMINVESIVENWWNKGKAWSRTVKKYFRKKCH